MSAAPAHLTAPERKKNLRQKGLLILLTLIPPSLVLLLCPLGMDRRQSGILAALILTILWWVTGAVERTVASGFLLAVFCLFSGAPLQTVFTFPLSENFLMIVASFLFSQGISNSGLADKLLQPLLARCARTLPQLLLSIFLCAFVTIFIIPQPFSRIIILAGIYSGYFDTLECVRRDGRLKPILMAAVFFLSVVTNMLLLRGDMILNNALLSMGEVAMGEGTWIHYMTVPTLAFLLLYIVLFCLVFRKELCRYGGGVSPQQKPPALSGREKRDLFMILAIVAFWAAEDLHGINGTITVIAGVVLMFLTELLHRKDWMTINVKLLVFLTAAFAIGGVLRECGVADILFSRFVVLFPSSFSMGYAAVVLLTAMLLHMVLGSNVTTMSVVVPGLMTVGAGVAPQEPLLFLIYIAVCGHFMLPFHHVTLLLGEGKGYYGTKHLLRFGIPLTALMLLSAMIFYMGWWRLMSFI